MSVVCVIDIVELPEDAGYYAREWQEIGGQLCDRVSSSVYATPHDVKAALRLQTLEWGPWNEL
jgi:hypothetical protein